MRLLKDADNTHMFMRNEHMLLNFMNKKLIFNFIKILEYPL